MSRADGLRVYDAAREFEREIIRMTRSLKRLPPDLKSQLVRAAGSVARCIAEGFGRGTPGQEMHFMRMARGSLDEARHDLRTLVNEKHITRKRFGPLWNRAQVIERILSKLIRLREEQRSQHEKREDESEEE